MTAAELVQLPLWVAWFVAPRGGPGRIGVCRTCGDAVEVRWEGGQVQLVHEAPCCPEFARDVIEGGVPA